ncbi:hypothetical protein [Atlantibacter hermannii]|uniref:hypothetical protein n=1 Tax=Atlantibacter hermannii TaxID=565 RepID=UPI0028AA9B46|nr:hypothetical protein [Atlantibacter hermannii]
MNELTNAIDNTASVDSLVALVASLHYSQTGLGRTSFVVTSKGLEVKTGFKVIDARSLVISNNLDGTINPKFPAELQPRDRTRMSSKIQVSKIAGNLRPAQLTDSGLSSHGAPIVGPDNVVESGNGRSMGILRAYEQGQADSYRQYLIEHAGDYGLKAADIEKMDMPVLVRERVTELDRAKFARDSNQSDLQEMAASEKAFVDAEMLDERLMAMFAPSEEGNLLARSNDSFIRSFMKEIGDTATAGLVTTDGRPTKQLIDRIQNAIFAKAYKDERLVKLVAEEPDPEMRNILTALNTAASDFAQMQMLSGDVHKQAVGGLVSGVEEVSGLDKQAIAALQDAINLVRQAKDSGQAIEEAIAQQGLFEETSKEAEALALFIVANNRSAKRIGAAFKKLAQKINAELTHQQQALGDMFGGGDLLLVDVLSAVSREIEEEFGEGKGLNFAMFESAAGAGDIDPYLAGLIVKASGVAELMRIVRLADRFRTALVGRDPSSNMFNLRHITGAGMPYSHVGDWVAQHQLSSSAVALIVSTASRSLFYTEALRDAVKENAAPPSLIDDRIVDMRIERFREKINGKDLDPLITSLHRIDSSEVALIPDEITMDEINAGCRLWVSGYLNMPLKERQIALTQFDKKIKNAKSIPQTIAAMQDAIKTAKKALADIDDVMENGKAALAAVGLTLEFSSEKRADAYINALERLKALTPLIAEHSVSEINEFVDFYIPEINKVRDRPEKLDLYLKDVFRPGTGFARAVGRLEWDLNDDTDVAIAHEVVSLTELFSRSLAYPPMLVKEIHSKVKAAMDAASSISEEQAEEWARGLKMEDEIADLMSKDNPGRKGFNLRSAIASVYRVTNGNLDSLKEVAHTEGVRAYATRNGEIVIEGNGDSEHVVFHEAGHHIEYSSPYLLERAKAFLKMKAGDRITYVNSGSRGDAEYIVSAGMSVAYMSKIYMEREVSRISGKLLSKPPVLSKCRSTEIFSMAMQCYADPEQTVKSLLNNDGLIEFFLGCLKELPNAN